jgi:hypothetical protein
MSALRDPDQVMRLSRMGASHPTRLSFMRVLSARAEAWRLALDRTEWDVDGSGCRPCGLPRAGQGQTYSLVAFAHDLPDHLRSDRVIAEAWDTTFALMDGEPEAADHRAAGGERAEAGGRPRQ